MENEDIKKAIWLATLMICAGLQSLCAPQLVIFQDIKDAKAETGSDQTRTTGNDWPSFLGAGQNGISLETGIVKDWSGNNLKCLWAIETGEGYSIGSMSSGSYFHFDRVGNSERLRCIQAETGEQVWSYQYPVEYEDMYGFDGGPRTSPVVDGNRVYTLGVEGVFTCVTADKGHKVWDVNVSERFGVVQNFFGVGSTPVIYKDKLLVMVGGSGGKAQRVGTQRFPDIKTDNSGLVAFDKLTGEVKYQSVDDLASYSTIKLASIEGKDIALVWARESLHGVDPADGKTVFEFPYRSRILESVNASTPVVHHDHIFLSECYQLGGTLLKIEKQKPTEIWSDAGNREKKMATHWNTPVLHKGHLYGSTGRNSGDAELRCVEFKTGKVKWSKRGLSRSSVTFIDGHLIVLGEYGQLLLVKATPEKFEQVSELKSVGDRKLTHPCWSAPIVSRGLMLVRGKRKVFCYELIPE